MFHADKLEERHLRLKNYEISKGKNNKAGVVKRLERSVRDASRDLAEARLPYNDLKRNNALGKEQDAQTHDSHAHHGGAWRLGRLLLTLQQLHVHLFHLFYNPRSPAVRNTPTLLSPAPPPRRAAGDHSMKIDLY